ncbi:MAG: hypothetical protein ACLFVJ_22415 [Persicimonas sp.]
MTRLLSAIVSCTLMIAAAAACSGPDGGNTRSGVADAGTDADGSIGGQDAGTDAAELPLPFEVPGECASVEATMAPAETCAAIRPDRLPEGLLEKLWVRGDTFVGIDLVRSVAGELVTLNGPQQSLSDMRTVWGCDQEWWAAGERGRIFRHTGDGFERFDLPESVSVRAGHGCGDEVIVGGAGLWRRAPDGGAWELWADQARWDPDNGLGDQPIDEVIDIIRRGPWLYALDNYGSGYVHNLQQGPDWSYHERSDDVNSDVFLRSDGRGFTLHHGFGLYMDLTVDWDEEGYRDIPLTDTSWVLQVSDTDYWLVGRRSTVRRIDGDGCTRYEVPSDDYASVSFNHATRDGAWLWMSAWLSDPDTGSSAPALVAFDRDQGWCVFANEQ